MLNLTATNLITDSPALETSVSQQKCVLFADNLITDAISIGIIVFSQGKTVFEAIESILLRYNLIGKPYATGPPFIFSPSIYFSHEGYHWVGNPIFCLSD